MDLTGPSVIGIDIGGANLKYAAGSPADPIIVADANDAIAMSRYFPMWRRQHSLADELADDLSRFQRHRRIDALAVTMTGELADCFVDREEGVCHIVAHACDAAARLQIAQIAFYGVDGNFHQAEAACANVDRIAAANWHALAKHVAGSFCSDGVLIDVGSTTTDIIPLSAGQVATAANTDYDRLAQGSLVYVGGRRTPVAMLVNDVMHQGQRVSIMNESFATMDDVRLAMRFVPEDLHDVDTADGRPRSVEMAVNRLARMIGLDRRNFSTESGVSLANQVHRAASRAIADAFEKVRRMSGNPNSVVITGHASDLIELPQGTTVFQLSDHLGAEVSRCAPAYAVASLFLSERRRMDQPCGA